MNNTARYLLPISTFLLVLLWCYAAVNKLIEFSHFRHEMLNQVIPREIGKVLIFIIPVSELTAALCLCTQKWYLYGLYLSLLLMAVFTGYIGLVYFNFFSRVPCSCGGILKDMGWGAHLLFNCFFLLIALSAIFMDKRERRAGQII
jgi:putative oxidoreductase